MAEIGSMQGPQVGRLLDLLPVGLKEAAIDSPTSRASITHFSEQIDIIEKWKMAGRLHQSHKQAYQRICDA